MFNSQADLFPRSTTTTPNCLSMEDERGAIFTRREVVDFILDVAGYMTDRPLWQFRLLEPSFGHGDFLIPVVERLLQAYKGKNHFQDLKNCVLGVEIHADSVTETRRRLLNLLTKSGVTLADSRALCDAWLLHDDYLLAEIEGVETFTHVVGNPPYVRQELIAPELMVQYRNRYSTIFDRADLYVPFFERSLGLLAHGGVCCMICSDRWMKNKYGAPLRQFVSSAYHLAVYVDMVGIPAFEKDVIAYPAITAIVRNQGAFTRLAYQPDLNPDKLSSLAAALRGEKSDQAVTSMSCIEKGDAPWLLHKPDRTELIRRLEAEFPSLEEAGCRVGIGVATGADKAFIAPFDAMDVEPSRKLPLVTTKDILDGSVHWRGLGVLNPFEEDGTLAKLDRYPKMASWLAANEHLIRSRHVAKTKPGAWYRTIDKITPSLANQAKLLVPDIKGAAHIVLEKGRLYPHHNLYYILSSSWDLMVLKAVLDAGIADLFVSAYSVKMAGGHLRYQAQYLRRIRLPRWETVRDTMQVALHAAMAAGDAEGVRKVVHDIYGLSFAEREMLEQQETPDVIGLGELPRANHRCS